MNKEKELIESSRTARQVVSNSIYDVIDKAFDAGRKAEHNYLKTDSTQNYKDELWNIQLKDAAKIVGKIEQLIEIDKQLEVEKWKTQSK